MFPASVKKLRPAFVGGAVGSVGASRRRWPPCRTSLRRSRKIPGFAVGVVHGGNVKGPVASRGGEGWISGALPLPPSKLPKQFSGPFMASRKPSVCGMCGRKLGRAETTFPSICSPNVHHSPKLGNLLDLRSGPSAGTNFAFPPMVRPMASL
jgi:hypothetical protein